MLDTETKRRIDTARDTLVGKIPTPQQQVEQITIALIYKFMNRDVIQRKHAHGLSSHLQLMDMHYRYAKLPTYICVNYHEKF